jgi:hypothetical protein
MMADQPSSSVKDLVDRLLEADRQEQIARRTREVAAAIGEAAETASQRAAEAWRESAPMRKQASRTAERAGRDAARWSRRTWQRSLSPALRRFIRSRAAVLGAAGAAAPVVGGLVDDAATRLGIRNRERRHWGAFFLGMLLGAAAGIVAALLTAPKAGREMRDELSVTARETAERAREAANRAREAATRAREAAAASAGDWVPIFQRTEAEEPIVEEVIDVPAPRVTKRRAPIDATPPAGDAIN